MILSSSDFFQDVIQNFLAVHAKLLKIQPSHIPLPLKPRQLTLRKMAGFSLDDINCLLKRRLSIKIVKNLFIAESLHRDHISRTSHVFEFLHFLDKSLLNHLINAQVNSLIEKFAVAVEHIVIKIVWRGLLPLSLIMLGDRLTGLAVILDRANHTLSVVCVNRLGGCRINLSKHLVEHLISLLLADTLKLFSESSPSFSVKSMS